MEVSGQLNASAALLPGKMPLWYPLDTRLGGPQIRSGLCGEEKFSSPHRELSPRTPILQLIAQRYTD
jgi:hypothetical protein